MGYAMRTLGSYWVCLRGTGEVVMAGRVTPFGIVALLVIIFLAKPGDSSIGRFQQSPPPRRRRYKCQKCGHVVTRTHRQQPPPPCTQCNGQTKLIPKRRQG